MRISVSSDMDEPVARSLIAELTSRGHDVIGEQVQRSDEPVVVVRGLLDARAHPIEMIEHRRQPIVEFASHLLNLFGVHGELLLLPSVAHGAQHRHQRHRRGRHHANC